ncbi:hypothetical protein R9X47_12420 [Wukongibacter baidiensis]|uniref:hypothetical protein n=1 Tax=Wukongibacter baidiensis TaxID=1723361 RepID=UPI003D7F8348
MKSHGEVLSKIISKFFEIGFYNQIYYEIVVTNKRLILVNMGESYKPWMLSIDPGINKREEFEKLDLDEIVEYNEKNISIDYDDIKEIRLNGRTLFKNANMIINTEDEEFKLYTKEKQIDFSDTYELLQKFMGEKVTLKK